MTQAFIDRKDGWSAESITVYGVDGVGGVGGNNVCFLLYLETQG